MVGVLYILQQTGKNLFMWCFVKNNLKFSKIKPNIIISLIESLDKVKKNL